MIDFKKKMAKEKTSKKENPIDIYDNLDRTSVTGPLRNAQITILEKWYEERKEDRDLIIKLHTGEGKTLIGLLILQSKINMGQGPCIYVCPNKYLVDQVCMEAVKFGIVVGTIGSDNVIPGEFYAGKMILVTHAQKLFNGKSIFGIGNHFEKAGCVILDDAHACVDAIRESFMISISRKQNKDLYNDLFNLFEEDLNEQGEGTVIDIVKENDFESVLPIPYWAWIEKKTEVLKLLSNHTSETFLAFSWALIRNSIDKCQAFIGSHGIEIMPINVSVDVFGTFSKAANRILMSATTQDDVFFIKTLDFDIKAVKNPLMSPEQKWSGEKMILLPSLISEEFTREKMIEYFSSLKYKFGVVSIVPTWKKQSDYKDYNCILATSENIFSEISNLKKGAFGKVLVLANRYDGIDLPDAACRILILDSLPFFTNMSDIYEEQCRTDNKLVQKKIAQKIEQGLGRSVRGERDYSCILVVGADIAKFMRNSVTRKLFSEQSQKQVEIGLQLAEWSKEERRKCEIDDLIELINQCLKRDEGWKEYYKSEMDQLHGFLQEVDMYQIVAAEKKAEKLYAKEKYDEAVRTIEKLMSEISLDSNDRGWYWQLMGRYKYAVSKLESAKFQQKAFTCNPQVMKPKEGIVYNKIVNVNSNRIQAIRKWFNKFESYEDILLEVNNLLENMSFGMEAEKFEKSIDDIGKLLGFESHRPDKLIRKGPDNLWCLKNNMFMMWECKSEVNESRKSIQKYEVGQMNNHCAWFSNEYGDVEVIRIMVIPTKIVAYEADFTHDVKIMRKNRLKLFKKNILSYIKEFRDYDIYNLSEEVINNALTLHKLKEEDLSSLYLEEWKKDHK